MENLTDSFIINEMFEVERNACLILESAKEEGNKLIKQARKKADELVEKTKEEILKNDSALEKRLKTITDEKVNQIIAKKQNILEKIEKEAELKSELALNKCVKFLLENVLGEL